MRNLAAVGLVFAICIAVATCVPVIGSDALRFAEIGQSIKQISEAFLAMQSGGGEHQVKSALLAPHHFTLQ